MHSSTVSGQNIAVCSGQSEIPPNVSLRGWSQVRGGQADFPPNYFLYRIQYESHPYHINLYELTQNAEKNPLPQKPSHTAAPPLHNNNRRDERLAQGKVGLPTPQLAPKKSPSICHIRWSWRPPSSPSTPPDTSPTNPHRTQTSNHKNTTATSPILADGSAK